MASTRAQHVGQHRIYFAVRPCQLPHLSMARFFQVRFLTSVACVLLTTLSRAQESSKATAVEVSFSAERGIALASKGRCREALPILKKVAAHLTDKQLKYRAMMATARCAMSVEQTETAVEALLVLNREFPHDPEVLYSTTRFYSELASRAAQELAATAPSSHQAQQLEAEAFESQENWDKAIAQYRKILDGEPKA